MAEASTSTSCRKKAKKCREEKSFPFFLFLFELNKVLTCLCVSGAFADIVANCSIGQCPYTRICTKTYDARRGEYDVRCPCRSACHFGTVPVCASNGETYNSLCQLHRRACIRREFIQPLHVGHCGIGKLLITCRPHAAEISC